MCKFLLFFFFCIEFVLDTRDFLILLFLKSSALSFRLIRLSKLAKRSELATIKVQQPNTNDANDTQTSQETGALSDAKVVEQRVREQDTTAGKSTAEEVVRGEETGGVPRVTKRHVDEDGLHDDEDSGTVDGDADGGHDPVDGSAGGPGEEEEANGWADGGGQGGNETLFLDRPAVLFDTRVHPKVEVGGVDRDTNDTGNEDTEEDKADLAEVHAVEDGVDEGEDLEDYFDET